ncbi:single-stranded-DNA-specific exonuclease RecJ [Nitrosomonas sp. Nm51]|uniref:single-stranded-DNA-specific exonuclease RecJ n=1 Tax=Nitrosomonas sp. Nm51 TaxID=133720 RepID=UPI000B81B520|nr:single-stranded-DNA-specific exonuclease RecJ [Nitrosomonas sp. Nm51]
MPTITTRTYDSLAFKSLRHAGLPPVLARIYAARGIDNSAQLETALTRLIPFDRIKNIGLMARLLADAIEARQRLLIIADYDSDGATACAVGMRILRLMGADVGYLVPNRFEYGYGLTPEIVDLAYTTSRPDILITVDNGIASIDGVQAAKALGMKVFITDHHLPGDKLPDATAIINPNQPGCPFPSKYIAGVGVIFYLMLALRAEFRQRGAFINNKEPNLATFLDLVALGTVADVVKLDDNNRILVQQGLKRIQAGLACVGINALLKIAGRRAQQTSTYDLGFILGPRLNAAGRLDDMSLGIECLITDEAAKAEQIARQLDALNVRRREIESDMQNSALSKLESTLYAENAQIQAAYSVCLFDHGWHQGVIGILASRIKDKYHRPVIIFAPGNAGEMKGSGRSIPGFHMRDALDLISKRYPGLIVKFGGHAAAAGLTILAECFVRFCEAFEATARSLLTEADLTRVIETDGELDASDMNMELAQQLTRQVWGQGFPQPTFNACFYVESQRVLGEKHLKLKLKKIPSNGVSVSEPGSISYDAILFFYNELLPNAIHAVYRLQTNEFNGKTTLQLLLEHWSQAETQPID